MNPPRFAQRLLHAVVPASDREIVAGDLAEAFSRRWEGGRYRAVLWYWVQVVLFCGWYLMRRRRSRAHRPVARGTRLSLDGWRQDARSAARQASRRPALTLVAITMLALGIGGTTAMFAVVDVVLVRPLPYPGADQLFAVGRSMNTGAASCTPSPTSWTFASIRPPLRTSRRLPARR